MANYRLHEADIEIPDGWQDHTINAYSLVAPQGGNAVNFTITRDSLTQSVNVQSYADLQLVEAAKKLKGYKLLGRRSISLDGEPAIEATYTWITPEKIQIQQRQAYVMRARTFVIFTLTTRVADSQGYEKTWGAILGSVRLRRE